MTLTHLCHNAFADSGGYLEPLPPLHGGLRYGPRMLRNQLLCAYDPQASLGTA